MKTTLTIVVIGRNEESAITSCLHAALAAADEVGGAELIYVDSHSTDRTVEIVRGLGVQVEMLDNGLRRCPSAGRYAGTLAAKGEYILFLDADTHIYTGFLPEAIRILENDPRLAGLNGWIDDIDENGERVTEIDERFESFREVKWLRGPSCLYRRTALLEVGSFDPQLAMEEEAELGLRLTNSDRRLAVIPVTMSCHTRCFHPNSLATTLSTFKRDLKAKRLGEVTRTIAHSFRNGYGLEFIWLRLETTVVFSAWLFTMVVACLLPFGYYSFAIPAIVFAAGAFSMILKKKGPSQALTFAFAKLINIIDVLIGIHHLTSRPTRPETLRSQTVGSISKIGPITSNNSDLATDS